MAPEGGQRGVSALRLDPLSQGRGGAARASGLPSFARAAGSLQRWQEEVLNYWHFPLTNALVEGKHNRLKVLKRRAYGYRNDRTFLLRILNLVHTD
jgi:transposase